MGYPIFCKKGEIKKLLEDPEVIWAINLWAKTKRWGLPYGGGWAEQPAWIMELLDVIEEADIRFKAKE